MPKRRTRQRAGAATNASAAQDLNRVAILTRISTDETNQPYSLETQRLGLKRYVESQPGLQITHRFVDQASGASLQRPGLQTALTAAAAGEFDILLVYRIDRLTRSIVGLMHIVEQLDTANVVLRSATEPIDTHGPVGRMLLQLLGIFAEFERNLLIDRIEAGFDRKAARGEWLGGRAPYGYTLNPREKTLTPDPAEAAIVRAVFAKSAVEHLGATAITRWLNQTGSRTRGNRAWTNQRILRMLHNPVYIGKISHDTVIHDGKHEPIINTDTWQRVQAHITERALTSAPVRPPNDSAYLLSGLLRCQACSNSYAAVSANGRRNHYRYYTCRTRQTRGTQACTGPRIPAEQLETAVINSLIDTYRDHDLFTEALAAAQAGAATEQPQIEAQLASTDKQLRDTTAALDRYLRAFEEGDMPAHLCASRVDELATRRDELTRHREELAQNLQKTHLPDTRSEDIHHIAQVIQNAIRTGEPSAIKHLLRQLIHQIKISPDWTAHPTYILPETQVPEPTPARAQGTTVRISEPFVGEGHICWQGKAVGRTDSHVLGGCPVASDPDRSPVLAEIASSYGAEMARAAEQRWIDRDPIAR